VGRVKEASSGRRVLLAVVMLGCEEEGEEEASDDAAAMLGEGKGLSTRKVMGRFASRMRSQP
jgi:hypothetical protein